MSRQLVPLRKIDPDTHGIPFSPAMLDWISFHREFNGAKKSGALVKCGGRVYVDPPRFLDWMATNPRISPPMKTSKARKKAIGSCKGAGPEQALRNTQTEKQAEPARAPAAADQAAMA